MTDTWKNYVFVRKMNGAGVTYVVEMNHSKAMDLWGTLDLPGWELGVIGGKNLRTIAGVYVEYRPFRLIKKWETLKKHLDEIRERRNKKREQRKQAKEAETSTKFVEG